MPERVHSVELTLTIDTNKRTTTYRWNPHGLDEVRRSMQEAGSLISVPDLVLAPVRGETLSVSRELLVSLTDADDCEFDHHGGCQMHGYLSLQPGEKCPQRELKDLLASGEES